VLSDGLALRLSRQKGALMTVKQSNTKELVIKLSPQERQQIKRATGEDIAELQIGTFEACVGSASEESQRPKPVARRRRFSRFTDSWHQTDDPPSA
jgi:hypothetical protein